MLFVDDSLLFCQATVQECQVLLNIFYHNMNRLLDKPLTDRKHPFSLAETLDKKFETQIKNLLRAKIMTDCEKYLGLPTVGRTKTTTFREIQERVTKRVLGWKEKFISKADREILTKMVAQSIPTYFMSLFRLPKAMCDAINLTLAKYWWGQKYDEKRSIG